MQQNTDSVSYLKTLENTNVVSLHSIVIGTIALSHVWLLDLLAVWIRIILWKIENMISK